MRSKLFYISSLASCPKRILRPFPGGTYMIGRMRVRVFISLFLMLVVSLPLAAFAQDEKKDEAKKEDKKEKKEEELPLKATDKIEFTTDEGTWMSIDVSSDGRMIVFDLLGDIYTMPATGGEARRIIGGISFESQPKFSPDAKKIVFLSDRSGAENLWVANVDGTEPVAVTKGRNQSYLSPSWTAGSSGCAP